MSPDSLRFPINRDAVERTSECKERIIKSNVNKTGTPVNQANPRWRPEWQSVFLYIISRNGRAFFYIYIPKWQSVFLQNEF